VRRILFALVLVAALAGFAGPAEAKRSVPQGFFGQMVDGPLLQPEFDLRAETSRMSSSGVESARIAVRWETMQPYQSFAEVPAQDRSRFRDAGGVPTDFSDPDRLVREATRRGLGVLPVVLRAPAWGRKYRDRSGSPPDTAGYVRFLTTLVRRYGPVGSFWAENRSLPRRPIRTWQIWNEVNHTYFWNEPGLSDNTTRSAPGYVELLRASRAALHRADRGVRVVHAGIDTNSWNYLDAVYRAGGRGTFDAFAAHPFTAEPAGVITILRYVRRVMARHGDSRRDLLITEWTWPSGRGFAPDPDGFTRTQRGQARAVTDTMRLFVRWRRRLRLRRTYHVTWISRERPGERFTYTGLRRMTPDGRIGSKPALPAYRRSALAYEGCRRKSSRLATRCLKRRR